MVSRASGSSVPRYMMMPTQAKISSALGEYAGERGEELAAEKRCSMGAGAGILFASIHRIRSAMKPRSAPLFRLHWQIMVFDER